MSGVPCPSQQGTPVASAQVASAQVASAQVASMFGRIARWYDPLNRFLSLGLDQRWRHCLAETVLPGPTGRVLDLAAGTLDVALALRRRYPDQHIPALDLCLPMLIRGKAKLTASSQQTAPNAEDARYIWPGVADARCLPLPDACVDNVTMAFGIRNINPRLEAFAEMHRVLTPGGRACILEFGAGQQKIWGGLYNFYLKHLLPRIGALCSGDNAYSYLARTIMNFPDADALAEEMRTAGFARVYHLPLTSGIVRLHVAEKQH